MKPSKKLIELAKQAKLLEKMEQNLLDEIEDEQRCFFDNFRHELESNEEDLQKFNEIRKINAQNLTFLTTLEGDICRNIDESLEKNSDNYISDYEERTSEQWLYLDGFSFFNQTTNDDLGKIFKDSNLVYDRSHFKNKQEYTEHLAWKEEEKAWELEYEIKFIDTVITKFEITYQFMLDYRKGKWVKVLYPPKYHERYNNRDKMRYITIY
jgi:hypothetical protein